MVLEALGIADDLLPHEDRGVDDGQAPGALIDAVDEIAQASRGDHVDGGSDGRPALHVHDRGQRIVDTAAQLQSIDEVVSLGRAIQRVVEEVVAARRQPGLPRPGQVGQEHGVQELIVLGGLDEDELVAGFTDPGVVDVAVVVADIDAADEVGLAGLPLQLFRGLDVRGDVGIVIVDRRRSARR